MVPSVWRFLLGACVAGIVFPSGIAAARGIVIVTSGDTIEPIGDGKLSFTKATATAPDGRQVDGPATPVRVGYKYSYFGVFWVNLWTSGGTFCTYEGDKYRPLTTAEAARALGRREADLRPPFSYSFPLGWLIFGPLIVLWAGVSLVRGWLRARAPTTAAVPKPRGRRVIALVGVFGVVILAGVIWLAVQPSTPPADPPTTPTGPPPDLVNFTHIPSIPERDHLRLLAAFEREGLTGITVERTLPPLESGLRDRVMLKITATLSPLDTVRVHMIVNEMFTPWSWKVKWDITTDPTHPTPPAADAELPRLLPTPEGKPGGSPYLPLRPGARWEYATYTLPGDDTGTETVTHLSPEVVEGFRCVPVAHRRWNAEWQDWLYPAENGVFGVRMAGSRCTPPVFHLPPVFDPASPRWPVRFTGGTASITCVTTVLGNREVDVPAGKYKAVCVWRHAMREGGLPAGVNTLEWYAPAIGLVKSVQFYESNYTVQNLKTYVPGR